MFPASIKWHQCFFHELIWSWRRHANLFEFSTILALLKFYEWKAADKMVGRDATCIWCPNSFKLDKDVYHGHAHLLGKNCVDSCMWKNISYSTKNVQIGKKGPFESEHFWHESVTPNVFHEIIWPIQGTMPKQKPKTIEKPNKKVAMLFLGGRLFGAYISDLACTLQQFISHSSPRGFFVFSFVSSPSLFLFLFYFILSS